MATSILPFPIGMERGAQVVTVSSTGTALDSAFVNGTADGVGDAIGVRFTAPATQTGAFKLYAFMNAAVTGAPTKIRCAVFRGPTGSEDAQRPGDTPTPIAETGDVDVSAQSANTWTEFSISSLSLTAGQTYWAVIHNATTTPSSNYATYLARGFNNISPIRITGSVTTDGWKAGDGTSTTNEPIVVLKFADGTILGNPFALSSAHANNTNLRGNRYNFPYDVKVSGVFIGAVVPFLTTLKIYQNTTEVVSVSLDRNIVTNGGVVFFAEVTFTKNTDYDVVLVVSGNSTLLPRIDAGASPPADVAACLPTTCIYVDGSAAGSLSAATDKGVGGLYLCISDFPAPAASGGGGAFAFIG
jgi:hypothetical protein